MRNRVLAGVALVLGAGAVLGDPYGGHVVTLDTAELARIVEGEVDHVTTAELASWLVAGRTDYRLLDLRSEAAYAEYHIPTAEHVAVSQLPDHPLLRNERVVVYSDGGIHAAQGWFLLQASGYRASYTLLGGLDAWKDEILFPTLPPGESPEEIVTSERLTALSAHFGGTPQNAEGGRRVEADRPLPTPAAPAAPKVAPRNKKKREGC